MRPPFPTAIERKASSEVLVDCTVWKDVAAFLPNFRQRTCLKLQLDWVVQDLVASRLLSMQPVTTRCAIVQLPGSSPKLAQSFLRLGLSAPSVDLSLIG